MDSPSAPPAAAPATAPAAASASFLFEVLQSALDHVKGITGVVTAIVALVAIVWKLINPADVLPPGMGTWAAGSLFGFFLLIDVLHRRRQQRHRELSLWSMIQVRTRIWRATSCAEFSEDDAIVIAENTPEAAREFLSNFALNQPGAQVALKVYVVLNTGNEAGSAPMVVTRPV